VGLFACNSCALQRPTCCMFLFWCPLFTGQKHSPNWLVTEAVERDALKLLNDSDRAHTVKPGLQDRPCTYQNTLILVPTSQVSA
jgi:hypothetical protein